MREKTIETGDRQTPEPTEPSEPRRETVCRVGCAAPLVHAFQLSQALVLRCPTCGVYVLDAQPQHGESLLDRTQFEEALRALRLANYQHILGRLGTLVSLSGCRLLDVGCSTGWFLEAATSAGCACYGIEPDEFFYRRLESRRPPGVQVVHGFFARDVPASWEPFDIITFHDVFEHLTEPLAVLRAVRERLAPGGLLVLSLPTADGFAFRLGRLLCAAGVPQPLERMFQVQYPFPHLFYFTRSSLATLAGRAGFEPVLTEGLRSFSARGAVSRAHMDRGGGPVWRYGNASALVVFALLQHVLPADNLLAIWRLKAA